MRVPLLLAFLGSVLAGGRAAAWDLEWIDLIGLAATDTATAPSTDANDIAGEIADPAGVRSARASFPTAGGSWPTPPA